MGGKKKPLRKTPVVLHLLDASPYGAGSYLAILLSTTSMKLTLASLLPSCQAKKKPLGGGFKVVTPLEETSGQFKGDTRMMQRGFSLSSPQSMTLRLTCRSFKYVTPCSKSRMRDSSKSGLREA